MISFFKKMKTISALFASALTAITILLFALVFSGCTPVSTKPTDEPIPVVPTTLVYSIDAPGGFDREEIAYGKPKSDKPETFLIEGKSTTISLNDAFMDMEAGTDDPFNDANLLLDDELNRDPSTDSYMAEVSILKAVTCKSILAHDPVDETDQFFASEGRVWCYTQVELPQGSSGLIQHIWRHEGVEKHRMELYVQGPSYRTSSFKTIDSQLKGHWTIEVATENGEVLDVVEFQVN